VSPPATRGFLSPWSLHGIVLCVGRPQRCSFFILSAVSAVTFVTVSCAHICSFAPAMFFAFTTFLGSVVSSLRPPVWTAILRTFLSASVWSYVQDLV
jgi:hypothetical protein